MDLTATKRKFADEGIALCRSLLLVLRDLKELRGAYGAHELQPGDPHEFVDGDFSPASNPHLSKAVIEGALFALGQIDDSIDAGHRNALREMVPGGLP